MMRKVFKIIMIVIAVIIATITLLFSFYSFFYGIAQADEILVFARDKVQTAAEHDRQSSMKKGYVVAILPDGHKYGVGEILPSFCIVKIPGETITQSERDYLIGQWWLMIDWEIVTFKAAQDGYRIRVFGKFPSVTDQLVGAGKITRTKVETFLNNWNGTVYSESDNEVTFDIGTYAMATSNAFWDVDVSSISFSESYNRPSGTHRITADYSATAWTSTEVEVQILGRKGTIVSHDVQNKNIVFDIQGTGNPEIHSGNIALMQFQEDVKIKVNKILYGRRCYIGSGAMNNIISAGGIITTDKTTVLGYVVDRLQQ